MQWGKIPHDIFMKEGETMKAYANILPLWDGVGVMQKGETWEKGDTLSLEPWSKERTEEEKKYRAWKKRMNESAQRTAELVAVNGNVDEMKNRAYRCNGAMRHLAAFQALIRHAKEHKDEMGLWTMKKRTTEKEVVKEWEKIRHYLSSHVGGKDGIAVAVTIGRCCRGWYTLRGITIGNGAMDFMLDAMQYLRKRRQWKNSSHSANEDSRQLLDYYDSRDIDSYLKELFEVYRMTLMIPKRTYKNSRAVEILEDEKIAVSTNENSYIVNAPFLPWNSNSGVALCSYEVRHSMAVECYSLYAYEGNMNNEQQ